jgi:hypothetical protein
MTETSNSQVKSAVGAPSASGPVAGGANLVLVAKIVDNATGREFEIDHYPFTFGRSLNNDLPHRSAAMSRMHGQILKKGDGYFIEDLGSKNGTYIGKHRVDGLAELKDGDVIRVREMPDQPRGEWKATFRLWYRAVVDKATSVKGA